MDFIPEGPHELWEQELPRRHSRVPKDQPERPSVTPERKGKMDRELVALGTLMKDSGVWWQLDGALNISLAKGEYIGLHADVDISVMREDVSRLENYLRERGYGLFKHDKNDERELYRRVGAKAFERDDPERW